MDASVAVITDDGLRKRFNDARKGLLGNVNLFGQYAMLAAYRHGDEWLDALLDYLESNRNYLYDFVNNQLPGIQMAKPEGTFLGWLDCRKSKFKTKPSEFFKENAKVMMNDGEWFGKGGKGFTRINFGCPREILADALVRMKEALTKDGV